MRELWIRTIYIFIKTGNISVVCILHQGDFGNNTNPILQEDRKQVNKSPKHHT